MRPATILLLLFAAPLVPFASGATYEVGPGRPLASIGAVPWESLMPGDTVLIHWRPDPYREKWVVCRQGAANAPITIRGVPGTAGELPVIEGSGAVTRPALNFWNEARGIIKIGGANNPPDTMPRHVTLENLDVRGARPPYTFTATDGRSLTYSDNAAPVYVEKGENITIRNCTIHDGGNGLFVSSGDSQASRDILVEGNYIYGNGIADSIYQHNNYTAALGIIFQFNRFGPLRSGCPGNNLKDRSAGLVVRYNWIEGGNRQLDLVDGEDSSLIRTDPRYRETYVYGNILVEPDAAGNRQIAHYGGDSGTSGAYRKGTLFFHHNTIISNRSDRTTLLRLSTNDERCDFRNNIAWVSAAGNTLALLDGAGILDLSHNWFKPGRVNSFGALTGVIQDDGTSITGLSPGFASEAMQDYRPTSDSACINAGTALSPTIAPAHVPVRQYRKHQQSDIRPADAAPDVGAYEFAPDIRMPCDVNGDGAVDVLDLQLVVNSVLGLSGYGGGDINGDSRVDVLDLQLLVNVILGIGPCPNHEGA